MIQDDKTFTIHAVKQVGQYLRYTAILTKTTLYAMSSTHNAR